MTYFAVQFDYFAAEDTPLILGTSLTLMGDLALVPTQPRFYLLHWCSFEAAPEVGP